MTARLFSVSLEPSNRLGSRANKVLNRTAIAYRAPEKGRAPRQFSDASTRSYRVEPLPLDLVWSSLIESLQQGVIVISQNLKPVYWNLKARELCQQLSEADLPLPALPVAVAEICHRFLRDNHLTNKPLLLECQGPKGQVIRISIRWLPLETVDNNQTSHGSIEGDRNSGEIAQETYPSSTLPPYMLVFLENCDEVLMEELQIEQQKYDLTDREAEIWLLLRQEYTYQEIANLLQISLNTVKTHVKNVYAKRRSYQGQDRFWCSE
jgi:hypothetical protein